MKPEKIFSKFNFKNYNDELEEILEEKIFSFDVKNLLLSMLYKIENAYKDYKTVKVEVLSIKEIITYIIKTIKEKCFDIEFIMPGEDKDEMIDKKSGRILCYPNETSLLSAVWYMGEEDDAPIVVKYQYEKDAIQNLLKMGSNISIEEVLRDFNGWSWDILVGEIESLDYNILYQSLLLLDGKRLFNLNIECDEKNSFLIQKDKKEYADSFRVLANCALNLYKKENKDLDEKIKQVIQEKQEYLDKIGDKKAFVGEITSKKKDCILQIEEIDKIINDPNLLKQEYTKRNESLPNKEKIFSISHLSDRLEKEREQLLKQIRKYNKMIEPKEFVKNKDKNEDELNFLQKKYNVMDCAKAFLECSKNKIESAETKEEIIEWIYKIRYYCQLPIDNKSVLKDASKLKKAFKDVVNTLIKVAQKNKVWDVFTEDEELSYMIIKELLDSKMISLENANLICEYNDKILYVQYYDGNTLEMKKQFEFEHVKIKKKIKLFL